MILECMDYSRYVYNTVPVTASRNRNSRYLGRIHAWRTPCHVQLREHWHQVGVLASNKDSTLALQQELSQRRICQVHKPEYTS